MKKSLIVAFLVAFAANAFAADEHAAPCTVDAEGNVMMAGKPATGEGTCNDGKNPIHFKDGKVVADEKK